MQLVVLKTGSLLQISIPLCFGNCMAEVFIVLKQLTQLLQLLSFRLPTLPELTQPIRRLKTIALELNPFPFRCLLRSENRQLHAAEISLGILHHLRLGGHVHFQLSGSFIDQIDRLIRQTPIADVPIGQPCCRHHRLIGNGDPVVQLISLLQSTEDLHTEFNRWLLNRHLLKAPVQSRILLHSAAIVLWSGGGDTTQLPSCQGRFQQTGRISTGSITVHHGVKFINEQHNGRFRIAHLIENSPKTFLELTAELGSSDQGTTIEGDKPQALQRFGHLTSNDPLRQEFCDRGLTHARRTNQNGVVFAASRQHLDQAANFPVPTDHWIKQSSGCSSREIAAVALQRCRLVDQLNRAVDSIALRLRGCGRLTLLKLS